MTPDVFGLAPVVVTMLAAAAVASGQTTQTATSPATPADSAWIDDFYPADRLKPIAATDRQSCWATLPQHANGQATHVLAAFTDRTTGAIRLLERGASGRYEVAFDQPDAWNLPGSRCTVRLRDVDLDGRPEVFVSFLGIRASTAWVFRWDGSTLTNVTPTAPANGRVSSMLLDPQLYDLDHVGALELVATRDIERLGPTERSRNPAYVYRLGKTVFEVSGSLLAIAGYRGDVDPRSNLRAFRLAEDSTGPFMLRIVNGDRNGRHRATGITVRVNDVTVVEPRDVTHERAQATVELPALTTQNHVTATLDGPADATVLIVVEDSTTRR